MGLPGRLFGHLAPQWAAQAASTRAHVGRRTMPAPSSGASWLAAPRPHTTALFGGPAPWRAVAGRCAVDASSDLNTEDDQPAAPGLPEFFFFAPAHFLSGQQGLREPKAYTLLLRLGSQRRAARPFGLGEVEYAVERRALDAGGMRRLRPRLAEGSAGNRLLHCDRQHAPPATPPA